jgi:nucleoside-diphosphate-sugar epimerase
MKIVVTGAQGFIGQWLSDELLDAGHWVFGFDRDEGDLLEPGVFADWLTTVQPDMVVHLAAQVGRLFSEDDVRQTVRSNAEMTTAVAQACGDADVRLCYASTSEVYGDHGDHLVDEDTPWRLPQGIYGLSQRWGEEACRLYAPDGLVIVRLSMPYGPGAPPGRGRRAMDTMLWAAHHRMPIIVHRGAERSWCWVGDTVRGIRLALEAPPADVPGGLIATSEMLTAEQAEDFKRQWENLPHRMMVLPAGAEFTVMPTWDTFNIGRDDDPRSMLEIAQLACKMAGAPEDLIELVDPPAGQTAVKRLSTARLRALGWEPTVELEEGMARVYNHVSRYDADGVLR